MLVIILNIISTFCLFLLSLRRDQPKLLNNIVLGILCSAFIEYAMTSFLAAK